MSDEDEQSRALRPWLLMLEECRASPAATPLLARAERVLRALAQGDAPAVPAWVAAQEQALDREGSLRDRRPARALRELREDREAVLRLGVWGALRRLQAEGIEPGFDSLMASVSSGPFDPPVLHPGGGTEPALPAFANSADAAAFFNARLKPLLANLARLYDRDDGSGARFGRWLALPDYVPGTSAVAPWAQAWTVAAVATYVDWLKRASGDSFATAMALVWAGSSTRFRPPQALLQREAEATRPAALPTDERRLHFELLLPVVLAQLLDHDAGRWAQLREGMRRFVVALSMKTLDQADSLRHDPAHAGYRHVTVYRGLTILQVYMATASDGLCQLQARGAR